MFKTTPVISIGIAAYNAERNISALLSSLLRQEVLRANIEEIIVHSDHSTDQTLSEINKVYDVRISVLETIPRQGFANAFIKLTKTLKGDIMVLLNDDIKIIDDHFIDKLIQPFFQQERVGLVGGNPRPMQPENFVERAVVSSYYAWDNMRQQLKNKNNAFTVDGKILALSREFAQELEIPGNLENMGNVDAYVYMASKKQGFKYVYASEAQALFKNPTNWKDHFRWAIRNNSNGPLLKKQFGNLATQEYKKPRLLYARCLLKEFFRNPFGALCIFFGSFYIQYKARKYAENFQLTWKVVESSKKLK